MFRALLNKTSPSFLSSTLAQFIVCNLFRHYIYLMFMHAVLGTHTSAIWTVCLEQWVESVHIYPESLLKPIDVEPVPRREPSIYNSYDRCLSRSCRYLWYIYLFIQSFFFLSFFLIYSFFFYSFFLSVFSFFFRSCFSYFIHSLQNVPVIQI